MAYEDDTQITEEQFQEGFAERIGSEDAASDMLTPEEEMALGEDMGAREESDQILDPAESSEGARDYTDEDNA